MADANSIYCPKCSQKTSVERRGGGVRGSDGYNYEIGECNNCSQHFLVKRYDSRAIAEIAPNSLPKVVDPNIPGPVSDDLSEAYKCFASEAWRATVTMARRSLQNICLDKKAPSKREIKTKEGKTKSITNDLVHQIDWLFNERVITGQLRDWAHEIRVVGNEGAHPGDAADVEPLSKQDAEDILALVEAFAGALYIAPALYDRRKAQVEGV